MTDRFICKLPKSHWGRWTAAALLALFTLGTAQADTLSDAARTGKLTLGYVTDEAPFSEKTSAGQPEGYSIELCQKVVDAVKGRSGLGQVTAEFRPFSLQQGLQAVADGELDLLCGASTDTLSRREAVSFSIPIFNGGVGALVSKSADPTLIRVLNGEVAHTGPTWRASINRGLADHTYAVHAGTVTRSWLLNQISQRGVIVEVVEVDTHADGIKLIAEGKADAYFGDRVIVDNLLQKSPNGGDLMLIDRYFTIEPIALALPRNDDEFRLVVDTVLSEFYRSDEFDSVYGRYFGPPSESSKFLFKLYSRQK
ncbi:amino acid ABC transporter substrate-binding protein [Ferrimonas gelatinilytica]|uniref:Amino acid ABC transporter substrate-binding protein n=1 Tax=Ferrimonas gelatinilytica TaxID=1255257 RepID=A0ABP9RYP2_9GAMM